MKFVFLYGPPAAGKLTIAHYLIAHSKLKLFHNHASIDAVLPIFPWGSAPFHRLVGSIRELIFDEVIKERLDLIFTYVYAYGVDDEHVARLLGRFESAGAELCLVHVSCGLKTVQARLNNPSRHAYGKLTSLEAFEKTRASYEMFAALPDRESLRVNTDELSAEAAAKLILRRFSLV